jgi:hypothetical protein
MTDRTLDGSPGPAERARAAAYREFMEPGELPAGARVDEAEARLGAMLERELGVAIEPADEEGPAASAAPGPARGFSGARRSSRLRTGLGIVATMVLVAGVSWVALTARSPRERVLRGTTEPASGSWNAEPTIQASASHAARLSWHADPRADSYTVVFLSADLTELARIAGVSETSFVLTPETRPAAIPADAQGLWRVDAYAGADSIARSPASPITFP